jgi:flavin-dependent dehydrogenase
MEINTEHFDVAIVGGGPAGTATGISLMNHAPGLKVALLEKTSFEKKRVGEILKPSAKELLKKIGTWEAFQENKFSPCGEICTAWGTEDLVENQFTSRIRDRGWDLDRRVFDSILFQSARDQGVTVFPKHRVDHYERDSSGSWFLGIGGPGQEKHAIKASFLVDATGQSPFIAPKQGAGKVRFDRLVGVYIIFHNKNLEPSDTFSMAETIPHGWWYSVPLPANHMLIAFMTDNDVVGELDLVQSKSWWDYLKDTRYTYNRVKTWSPVTDFCMRLADSFCMDRIQGEGWASVGDATARMDPVTGHGINWAMQSGIWVAQPIIKWLNGDSSALKAYQKKMDEEYGNYLFERWAVYSMEQKWAGNPFWERRHDAGDRNKPLREYLAKSRFNSMPMESFHYFDHFQNKFPEKPLEKTDFSKN